MQAEPESQQLPSERPQAEASVDNVEKQPGLIIIYVRDQVIHEALDEPGAPIAQGVTPSESVESFQEYIFQTILGTPASLADNCVIKSTVGGVPSMFPGLFHHLAYNQIYRVMAHLTRVFITSRSQTA